MRIAITGASGLVGSALIPVLTAAGHQVLRLVRRTPAQNEIAWDPERGQLDREALEGVDAVIHLAGENVGEGRWTEERKHRILESRTKGTRLLAENLAALKQKPSVLISASAVGYYGNRGDETITETSLVGSGFLSDVCVAWEAAADAARAAGIRVVHPRIGVVLSHAGGALPKMALPVRMGVGGAVGSGQQYIPWISMADLIGSLQWFLEKPVEGVFNVCAPGPVSSQQLNACLGKVLHRPVFLKVPAFAIRGIFGQMGEEVLLGGAKVVPQRLLQAGFVFKDSDLEALLRQETR